MQRALIIKMHGDKDIGSAIVSGMESCELKRLREIVGIRSVVQPQRNQKNIEEFHKRFPIKEHSERYNRFWGYVGLIWLIIAESKKKVIR